jgi:acetate kinase
MSKNTLLVLNAGSSSIKYAVFRDRHAPDLITEGIKECAHGEYVSTLDKILEEVDHYTIGAIGHRVVHGGARFTQSQRIDADMITELKKLAPLAPEHVPQQVELIEHIAQSLPEIPQIACFDTAFHTQMPEIAKAVALPKKITEKHQIQRYGFHGLSYAYIFDEIKKTDPDLADGRLVIAHLGHGASMAAIKDGICIETTMGFSPTGGFPMGTRSGDLDPGVMWYVMKNEGMDADYFYEMTNKKSGLLGVSGISSDMRELIKKSKTNPDAAKAVELFCYQIRKTIGAFAAVLGGVDTIIFTGGIGENSKEIRDSICADLTYLGDVQIKTMHTDEAKMIARDIVSLL